MPARNERNGGTSLFALVDDIASILDDVSVMTKVAAKKTARVLGDDLGLYLPRCGSGAFGALSRKIGGLLLAAAPLLMKALSVLGTAAMFLVGGGILSHGWHRLQNLIEIIAHHAAKIPGLGGLLKMVTSPLLDAAAGMGLGAVILAGVAVAGRALLKLNRKFVNQPRR